ncbi:hypothetical protein [Pseudolysinimonas sp.]|uniref:hypothetical protein n=1 Tax=Pseudolysinimonas sp. TaxID=2680009 RepID=UPI003F821CEC
MSDIPHPRTHDIDLAAEHDDITEDVGPDLQSGDDLDTGAIVGGPEDRESPADELPDDAAGSEAS